MDILEQKKDKYQYIKESMDKGFRILAFCSLNNGDERGILKYGLPMIDTAFKNREVTESIQQFSQYILSIFVRVQRKTDVQNFCKKWIECTKPMEGQPPNKEYADTLQC
mmetsp:Transcript_318/g.316  ORF Transcript_318/g.316 Transcript_318/m.316 type:complete len:109 (+) Transcript_318:534-860(+)